MSPEGSRTVLGFDYGTKSIGVAIGQEITGSASALKALRAADGIPDWDEIGKLLKQWQPDLVVVGLPLNMDGTEQEITVRAKKFARRIEGRFGCRVVMQDERLTTVSAREHLFDSGGYRALKKGSIDSYSAVLILEDFFDSGGVSNNTFVHLHITGCITDNFHRINTIRKQSYHHKGGESLRINLAFIHILIGRFCFKFFAFILVSGHFGKKILIIPVLFPFTQGFKGLADSHNRKINSVLGLFIDYFGFKIISHLSPAVRNVIIIQGCANLVETRKRYVQKQGKQNFF